MEMQRKTISKYKKYERYEKDNMFVRVGYSIYAIVLFLLRQRPFQFWRDGKCHPVGEYQQ
jgi:hypothetical protein